jgi:hypothetical protein
MKNKKELSTKVEAILRDGRKTNLFHTITLILSTSSRFFVSLISFHITKVYTIFENLNLPADMSKRRLTLSENL